MAWINALSLSMKSVARFLVTLLPFMAWVLGISAGAAYGLVLLIVFIFLYRFLARKTNIFELRFKRNVWLVHFIAGIAALLLTVFIIASIEEGLSLHLAAGLLLLYACNHLFFLSK